MALTRLNAEDKQDEITIDMLPENNELPVFPEKLWSVVFDYCDIESAAFMA